MDENVQLATLTRAEMRKLLKSLGVTGMSKATADKMRSVLQEHQATTRAPLVPAPKEDNSDADDDKEKEDPADETKENNTPASVVPKRTTRSSRRALSEQSMEEQTDASEKSQGHPPKTKKEELGAESGSESLSYPSVELGAEADMHTVEEAGTEVQPVAEPNTPKAEEAAAVIQPVTEPATLSYPSVELDAQSELQDVEEVVKASEPVTKAASVMYPSAESEPLPVPLELVAALVPPDEAQESAATSSSTTSSAQTVIDDAQESRSLTQNQIADHVSTDGDAAATLPSINGAQTSSLDDIVNQVVTDQALDDNCHRVMTPPPVAQTDAIAPAAEPMAGSSITERPFIASFLAERNFSVLVPIFAREELNDWTTVRALSVDTLRSLGVTAGTAIRFCLAVKTLFGNDTTDPHKSVNPAEVTFSVSVDNVQSIMEELSNLSLAGAPLKLAPSMLARGISNLPRRPASIETTAPPRKRVAAVPTSKPATPLVPKSSPPAPTPRRPISGLTPKRTSISNLPAQAAIPPANKVPRVALLRPAEDKPVAAKKVATLAEKKTAAPVKSAMTKPKVSATRPAGPTVGSLVSSRTRAAVAAKAPVVSKPGVAAKPTLRTTSRPSASPAASSEAKTR
ncbi:hypothetical protein HDU86_006893 [Geranomyces michiganensis]|nr:hypothetical protein HDU86_006893 [Geranomyces michiganensis]